MKKNSKFNFFIFLVFYFIRGGGAHNFNPYLPPRRPTSPSIPPPISPTIGPQLLEWSKKSLYGIDNPTNNLTHLAPTVTDDRGRSVPSLTSSLKINQGFILLSDTHFLDSMAHFNRERIPERVVHAKGTGAFGYFKVTHDVTKFTRAVPFAHIGKETPVFVRFSTSTGELGSADTFVDRRGFATKFYTEQGNWDLVSNNVPVFPIRDPILFPQLVRSAKRNPRSNLRDVNAFFDFNSLLPESTMHTLQVFSDLGFPDGYRHMGGNSVHFFKCVNSAGFVIFCKFYWLPQAGLKNMTLQQSFTLAGINPDYASQDLYEKIELGAYPKWDLFFQVMTPEQAFRYKWNPFDATKIILEKDHPLVPVGTMILNKNPHDFFTQVEMAAFSPSNLIPGFELSQDPLLIGRGFGYGDTQRHRLGPNFLQFEVNRPKVPTFTYDRGGACAQNLAGEDGGRPVYFPNSFAKTRYGKEVGREDIETPFLVNGVVDRADDPNEDNFSQPKIFLEGLGSGERRRLVNNLAFFLKNVLDNIKERQLRLFGRVDKLLEKQVRETIKILPVGA